MGPCYQIMNMAAVIVTVLTSFAYFEQVVAAQISLNGVESAYCAIRSR